MGFGPFSSSSKSKTSSSTVAQSAGFSDIDGQVSSTSVSTGKRSKVNLQGANSINLDGASGNNVTVHTLDGGAISEAFDFAKDVSASSQEAIQGTVSQAVDAVLESSRTETENVSLGFQKIAFWGVLLFGGAGVLKYLMGRKK